MFINGKHHQLINVCIHVHTTLNLAVLGQMKVSLLVRFPDFRGCNIHKQGIWDNETVLFIEQDSTVYILHTCSFHVFVSDSGVWDHILNCYIQCTLYITFASNH